jgi:uncharacterized membrane protein
MWWMVDVLIAQAQASQPAVDPWTLAAGGGGAFGLVMILVGRIDKFIDAWSKKRNGGGDHDSVAKETTRAQVAAIHKGMQDHGDTMMRIAQSLERQAETLRDTRRQNSDEHRDIADLIRDRR